MHEGLVIRTLSGFFDVVDHGTTRRCRARGVFRKRGTQVLVGDYVEYEPIGSSEGVITRVLPRQTQLSRPPVANVDQALLVFSIDTPAFQPGLLDRALVSAATAGLQTTIVITKCDLVPDDELDTTIAPYRRAGFTVIPVAVKFGRGISEIWSAISHRVNVFVGPSGAGKSSIGNALSPDLGLKMGEVSEKIGRGRHTTRHVELFRLNDDTFVVDAPGFSQLDVTTSAVELRDYFPEFLVFQQTCPYRGCLHVDETDCAVKAAVVDGRIDSGRYQSYCTMYQQLRDREATRY